MCKCLLLPFTDMLSSVGFTCVLLVSFENWLVFVALFFHRDKDLLQNPCLCLCTVLKLLMYFSSLQDQFCMSLIEFPKYITTKYVSSMKKNEWVHCNKLL